MGVTLPQGAMSEQPLIRYLILSSTIVIPSLKRWDADLSMGAKKIRDIYSFPFNYLRPRKA